jgi:hypothetical protein
MLRFAQGEQIAMRDICTIGPEATATVRASVKSTGDLRFLPAPALSQLVLLSSRRRMKRNLEAF